MNFPSWILERAFGGTHVADTPGATLESGPWPTGDTAPPAGLVCELLSKAIDTSSEETYCFLIGGAGNGKSFLARNFAAKYVANRVSAESKFAERNYDYLFEGNKFLRIVNDATIPPSDPATLPIDHNHLTSDINSVFSQSGYLLACVNRGILISEQRKKGQATELNEPAGLIIDWLLNSGSHLETSQENSEFTLCDSSSGAVSYYGFCQLKHSSGRIINVHAAFMDQTSLFECQPDLDKTQPLTPNEPIQTNAISLAVLGSEQRSQSPSPAINVLSELYTNISSETNLGAEIGGSSDPLAANLENLNNHYYLSGLCSVIRGAEILSATHVTYRDLWGISIVALLGAVPMGGYNALDSEVSSLRGDFQSSDLNTRLCSIVHLATRRSHMALFSSQVPEFVSRDLKYDSSLYPSVGSIAALTLADPLLSLTVEARDSIGSKLALIEESSPVGQKLADSDSLFSKIWTPFDAELETTILRWLEADPAPPLKARNELLSWYARYLYRLYSVSRGFPADVQSLGKWQTAWNQCSEGKNKLPKELRDGLDSLIFSTRSGESSSCLLPLLSSHVEPSAKYADRDRVVLEINPSLYKWKINSEGDSLVLKLSHLTSADNAAEIQLDYPILREALVQSRNPGFTESSLDVEPRVERIRAKILTLEQQSSLEDIELKFIAKGKSVN